VASSLSAWRGWDVKPPIVKVLYWAAFRKILDNRHSKEKRNFLQFLKLSLIAVLIL
jgi:hypothetical protein